jgi:acyl-coenzyme A thioesterase PaaI-like protein
MWRNLTKTISMTAPMLKHMLNWWPPMSFGPGIRVTAIQDDFRYAKVALPIRWYNRNYVGTHFGGSLYSMCDPMYMLMLINILGPNYIVWDKTATIDYRKPGKGLVSAEFQLSDELIDSLRGMQPDEKRLVDLTVVVKDEEGGVVAHVVKTEYIKRKDRLVPDTPSVPTTKQQAGFSKVEE